MLRVCNRDIIKWRFISAELFPFLSRFMRYSHFPRLLIKFANQTCFALNDINLCACAIRRTRVCWISAQGRPIVVSQWREKRRVDDKPAIYGSAMTIANYKYSLNGSRDKIFSRLSRVDDRQIAASLRYVSGRSCRRERHYFRTMVRQPNDKSSIGFRYKTELRFSDSNLCFWGSWSPGQIK